MKIRIKLTPSELKAFFEVLRHLPLNISTLENRAAQEAIMGVIIKLQRMLMCPKANYTLSLNMQEAHFIDKSVRPFISRYTVYEQVTSHSIVNLIHQKTI